MAGHAQSTDRVELSFPSLIKEAKVSVQAVHVYVWVCVCVDFPTLQKVSGKALLQQVWQSD